MSVTSMNSCHPSLLIRLSALSFALACASTREAPPAQAPAATGPAASVDPSQTPEQRARALVAQLTLEEKVGQMMHDAPAVERLGIPAYNWCSEALHGVARAGL